MKQDGCVMERQVSQENTEMQLPEATVFID